MPSKSTKRCLSSLRSTPSRREKLVSSAVATLTATSTWLSCRQSWRRLKLWKRKRISSLRLVEEARLTQRPTVRPATMKARSVSLRSAKLIQPQVAAAAYLVPQAVPVLVAPHPPLRSRLSRKASSLTTTRRCSLSSLLSSRSPHPPHPPAAPHLRAQVHRAPAPAR